MNDTKNSIDQTFSDFRVDIFRPKKTERKRKVVPIWEKGLLTLEEAAEYTGLGLQKLREISNDPDCEFVLWNGTKRMFKRKKLDEFLNRAFSI